MGGRQGHVRQWLRPPPRRDARRRGGHPGCDPAPRHPGPGGACPTQVTYRCRQCGSWLSLRGQQPAVDQAEVHEKSLQTLELPKVLARVAGEAGFSVGRERVLALQPTPDLAEAKRRLAFTSEAV